MSFLAQTFLVVFFGTCLVAALAGIVGGSPRRAVPVVGALAVAGTSIGTWWSSGFTSAGEAFGAGILAILLAYGAALLMQRRQGT